MKFFRHHSLIFSFFVFLFLSPVYFAQAQENNLSYPRLANYFLHWEINDIQAQELAKWDLLVLDMELQRTSPRQLEKIRSLNPDIILLAYISSQEIMNETGFLDNDSLRKKLLSNIAPGWWLKDDRGQGVSFWPGTAMLNLSNGASFSSSGQRFNEYLPEFVNREIKSSGFWDGVFYDNLWGDICWLNQGRVDIYSSGQLPSCQELNEIWSSGVKKMLSESRRLLGPDFIIAGNGQVYAPYFSYLNGLMIEDFPASWTGPWSQAMAEYFSINENITNSPVVNIVNRACSFAENYNSLRFGLASALLGDAYFSADKSVSDHGQTWWYDEYDLELGPARNKAYNLLEPDSGLKAGLWRRDFRNGVVLVNSSNGPKEVIFSKENLVRITGSQDRAVNSGERVNWLELPAGQGLILLKRDTEIIGSNFNNGNFLRVYNQRGQSVQDGFFSYLPNFAGDQEVLALDLGDGEQTSYLSAKNGKLELYRRGKLEHSFYPFGNRYRGPIAFAFSDNQIITAIRGQVRIFNLETKLLGVFPIAGSGTINLAAAAGRIIIGSNDPVIRSYDFRGRLKNEFFAYDSKWRGGVNVAIGDLNKDGRFEIVSGPRAGGGPQIRIFSLEGKLLGQFLAYDASFRKGIKPSLADIDYDGKPEILVGIKNF